MKIVKTATLVIAFVIGGVGFQVISLQRVHADDYLTDTCWGDYGMEYCFMKQGKWDYSDMGGAEDKGTYYVNGASVVMTNERGGKYYGTVSGNKMTIRWRDTKGVDHSEVVTKGVN